MLWYLFQQYYVYRTPTARLGFMIPPLQILCKYEEGISMSKYAAANPTWEPNNKFGIYVYAEVADFFELAQNLVNSNNGAWGYVLIPYNVDDRDTDKWTRVFEQLSAKKLIPVVQLWSLHMDKYKEETEDAARFLNKFNWPIKYRYIAVYNEPNDAKFWFDYVSPQEYADVLNYTIETFKNKNPDFQILNAGFNTSASTTSTSMDAFEFMKKMNEHVPGIFEKLNGWASHSYPQPNFSGNPHNIGRWSIQAYATELDFLKQVLGVRKELPVFITETGWAHAEGADYNGSYLSVDKISEYFETAYTDIWLKDERVRAVMPFTIWFEKPYDHFSWVNADKIPYAHYNVVKDMQKIKGKPPMLNESKLMINVCDVQN